MPFLTEVTFHVIAHSFISSSAFVLPNDLETLLDVQESLVKAWHEAAKQGDQEALDKLKAWAYAYSYKCFHYDLAAQRQCITHRTAEDLVDAFAEVFDKKWPDARNIVAFVYGTTRQVAWYHQKGRGRRREVVSGELVQRHLEQQAVEHPLDETVFSDIEWRKMKAFEKVYERADALTQEIVERHILSDPGETLQAIADALEREKGMVVMRWSRFKKAVQALYAKHTPH